MPKRALNRARPYPDAHQQLGTRVDIAGGPPASFAALAKSETEPINRITYDPKFTFN